MTEISGALEVEIAKLQLRLEAVSDRMDRIDKFGTQASAQTAETIAVIQSELKQLSEAFEEVRADVKKLLSFRAVLFGGASVVSFAVSTGVVLLFEWLHRW